MEVIVLDTGHCVEKSHMNLKRRLIVCWIVTLLRTREEKLITIEPS